MDVEKIELNESGNAEITVVDEQDGHFTQGGRFVPKRQTIVVCGDKLRDLLTTHISGCQDEVYVVAALRQGLPKASKVVRDRFFHSVEEALSFIEDLEEDGYDPLGFGVFLAHIEIKELVANGRIGGT